MELSTALSLVSSIFADNSPCGIARREKLEALLTEKLPISNFIARLIAIPETEGGYSWVSRHVNDVNFPTIEEPCMEGAQLVKPLLYYGQLLEALEVSGRRAANAAETLLYGIRNPEEQQKYFIVGLGQTWIHPKYGTCGVAIFASKGRRRTSYSSINYCKDAHILTFPMTAAEIARRDAKNGTAAVTAG